MMTSTATRRIAVAAYLLLLGLIMAWRIAWAPPPEQFIALLLLVHGAPLLVPLRGLLHGRRYTYRWAGMLILAYFAHGIATLGAAVGIERWLGGAEAGLALVFFIAAIAYVRKTPPPAVAPVNSRSAAGRPPAPGE